MRALFLIAGPGSLSLLAGCALFQPATPAATPAVAPPAQPMTRTASDTAPPEPAPAEDIVAWADRVAPGKPAGAAPGRGAPPFEDPIQDLLRRPPADGVLALPPDYLAEIGAEHQPPAPTAHPPATELDSAPATTADRQPAADTPPPAAPPAVLSVNVAAHRPPAAGRHARRDPAVNQGAAAGEAASLRELVSGLPAAESGSVVDAVDRRLLAAIGGDLPTAREPIPGLDATRQKIVDNMIDLVLALRANPEPAQLAQARVTLESLRSAVHASSDLAIPTFTLCDRVDGFGRYSELEPPELSASRDTAFVAYCELKNFVSHKENDGQYRSEFSLSIDILNRLGDRVHQFSADNIVDRCRSPRSDCFISPLVDIPALPPGEYVVKVTIVDRIGQKVAQRRAALRMVAR